MTMGVLIAITLVVVIGLVVLQSWWDGRGSA